MINSDPAISEDQSDWEIVKGVHSYMGWGFILDLECLDFQPNKKINKLVVIFQWAFHIIIFFFFGCFLTKTHILFYKCDTDATLSGKVWQWI